MNLKQFIKEEVDSLFRKLASKGSQSSLEPFNVPNEGSGSIIVKNVIIEGEYFQIRDNGRVVTLFDENKNLLARLFYDNDEGVIEIGIIESMKPGKGYGKIIMLYLSSKYGYENIDREFLTSAGEKMRSELDSLFEK